MENTNKTMLLLADNTELEVKAIHGSKQYVQNANRDVLTIEIPVKGIAFDTLVSYFQDEDKTKHLYTKVYDEAGEMTENDIGQHYSIYLSASLENRESQSVPGTLAPPEIESIYVVKIAQITYMELQLQQLLARM
ncbi:hypothetical protein LJC63_06395 [Ruminococcaceae bacterium OttesenSCG-928-L11]|nr:hypothetical protein [Ruminococcaceae bacterium OttesenSCG-928-L11]